MKKRGGIVENASNFVSWSATDLIEEAEFNQIRLSRGFLQVNPSNLFPNLSSFWKILFQELNRQPEVIKAVPSLDFPDGLSRVVPFQVDNETVVIGMDEKTSLLIGSAISDCSESNWIDVVVEYFERRLIATLGKTWVTQEALKFIYLGPSVSETVEVVGSIRVTFSLDGAEGDIWFGLGPVITERLDVFWKDHYLNQWESGSKLPDQIEFSMQIGEIVAPDSHVTDYLKPGTIIDIGQKHSPLVQILKNGALFAMGTLFTFNGRFAARIDKLLVDKDNHTDSWNTRIGIEICSSSIKGSQISEYSQPGAFILTGAQIEDGVYLKIGGENLAYGQLGLIDENLAVSIIER